MGEDWWRDPVTGDVDGKRCTAQEIFARVLWKLERDAEAYLGEDVTDKPADGRVTRCDAGGRAVAGSR
ncbi:hypothetical protein ACFYOY_04020 [Streptomyces sp. NPDC007875]|uniref:hypothetical protein n=1 Tax=Streptomyces sp. NPDC007875 TaxID=3364783 RepID=UPI0036922AF4